MGPQTEGFICQYMVHAGLISVEYMKLERKNIYVALLLQSVKNVCIHTHTHKSLI